MIKAFIKNLSNTKKITYSIASVCFVLVLLVVIPTLANLINSNNIPTTSAWDGSVASSYAGGNGTIENPYIISNGSELAYFETELQTTDYANTYFALSDNIILNEGMLSYNSNDGIKYILNDQTYYVDAYTNNYYSTIAKNGSPNGTLNSFPSLKNFKGHFNGRSYTIYGLYITEENATELGLFINLQGNVENLQIANAIVYGGIITGGIASSTNNATLNNILFDGFVVGTEMKSNESIVLYPPALNLTMTSANPPTEYIDILNTLPFLGGQVISQTINGYFNPATGPAGQMNITVNGVRISTGNKAASFGPDNIGTVVQDLPVIATIGNNNGTAILNDLVYTITYNYSATGGIVGHSSNTSMTHIINKAEITGRITSGGLVGTATNNLTIEKSYNNGIVRSDYAAGGLVGKLEKSTGTNINQSYNTGSISSTSLNSGGLIGIQFNNDGAITLNNVFNTANNYTLGTIDASSVNVTESYYVYDDPIGIGTINGTFTKQTTDLLQAKNVLISMGFYEFISEEDIAENPENCWVYRDNDYPLLYSDTKVKPPANIYVGNYVFSQLSENVGTKAFKSNIGFIVEASNIFMPIKEKYYYISSSTEVLSINELQAIEDWTLINDIQYITNQGSYIIYAKIVDYNDNINYLNSDILLLDLVSPTVSVSLSGTTWTDLRSDLQSISLSTSDILQVNYEDDFSGISSIQYYFSNEIISESELTNVTWIDYDNEILLQNGSYVVYVKVEDVAGNITYVNTDYISFVNYIFNDLTLGHNIDPLDNEIYITDKSKVTFNISYRGNDNLTSTNYNHNLVSNILLPNGTKITLIDNINGKVYQYKITTDEDLYNYNTSCDNEINCLKVATYPFTLFKEVGTGTTGSFFTESTYYEDNMITENFTIIVDLGKTNIITNYDEVMLYMELDDSNEVIRSTSFDSIKTFNIYYNNETTIDLTSDYDGSSILFNNDTSTVINLTSKLNYKQVNNFNVIDTNYEDKKMGLYIKMTDSNGNIIDKEYLKNFAFKIGDNYYYPENDSIIHINLNGVLEESNLTLTIITHENNSNLREGTYYFKISNFVSYNGYYASSFGSNEISIPVVVSNSNIDHDFDITMDKSYSIINKANGDIEIPFDVYYGLTMEDPNIRVSLYEKNEFTAYNQSYSLIDLKNYVSTNLNQYTPNIYYVNSPFKLNFLTSNLNNNGYKLIFELYDGNKKIGTIEKYFIVK